MLGKFLAVPARVITTAAFTAAALAGVQPALAVGASPVFVLCSTSALASVMSGVVSGDMIRLSMAATTS